MRDEKGRFIPGHKINIGKSWKGDGRNTSKMGGVRIGGGFKKGNTLAVGKAYRLGKKATIETKTKQSLAHRREKSVFWKGGVTKLRKAIRECFKYRQWRSDIFTRDNYTCQICGTRSTSGLVVKINADHYPKSFAKIFYENNIKSISDAFDCMELWNINNGRTLCVECHLKTENHGKPIKNGYK